MVLCAIQCNTEQWCFGECTHFQFGRIIVYPVKIEQNVYRSVLLSYDITLSIIYKLDFGDKLSRLFMSYYHVSV